MRKLILPALAAISLFATGCSEDFDVAAPYKNITIVYGLLNHADSVHYVRIQKAFMDQDKSAIDMAKVADSSYYPDGVLEVMIKEIKSDGTIMPNPGMLPKVNMADEGVIKEPGTFFQSPNYAYKYVKKLDKNNKYRLVIKNTLTGDIDSAETGIIPSDTTNGNFYVIAFGSLPNQPPFTISFARTMAAGDRYKLAVNIPEPAKALEGVFRFTYWERDNVNPDAKKVIDFPFATAVVANRNAELSIPNSAFYDFFQDKLGTAPANTQRFLDSFCEIIVYAGSSDFYDYQQITGAQMNGITSNEIKPIYTNLKGPGNTYGLFTSRAIRHGYNLPIAPLTFDSLAANPKTKPTGLQDQAYPN